VERRADALVGLRADDHKSPDPEARQDGLEAGALEGVPVVLFDERLVVLRGQLGDDPPRGTPPRELLVGVLDPDNGDLFPPRLVDNAADVGDNRVALVRPSTTPICTSTTRRAVFGRFWNVVMASPDARRAPVPPTVAPATDTGLGVPRVA
jgi:hypothetical protein